MDDTTRETLRKLQDGFNQLIESLVPKAANADGWIEWGGGVCPVPADRVVQVKTRSGYPWPPAPGREFRWRHSGPSSGQFDNDIVAYRIVAQQPKQPDAVPAPDGPAADVWFNWHGGPRPVKPDTLVDVRYRDGETTIGFLAGSFRWNHIGGSGDIVAWRFAAQQPKPGADGWIEWKGGVQPVSLSELVEVRLRDGTLQPIHFASRYTWRHGGAYDDIVAYRLVNKQPQPDADGWIKWGGEGRCPVPGDAKVDVKKDDVTFRGALARDVIWSCVESYRIVGQQPKPVGTILTIRESSLKLAPGEAYAGVVIKGRLDLIGVGATSINAYHLVLLPDLPGHRMAWRQAKEWAESVGGRLPTRQEQSLLFANLDRHFEEVFYWSEEEYEPNSSSAWGFHFGGRRHEFGQKCARSLARAVRVVPV